MRFLLDECVDARLLGYLQLQGHDVTAAALHYSASLADHQVFELAHGEGRILVTNDRGFGAYVVVNRQPHAGVILLRLGPHAELSRKIERLGHVITNYAPQLDRFLVVTRDSVRIR